jgi:hypothetical protein
MFRLPKSVLSFGAGAVALGVLVFAAPRAAHAIAATLVQVANTSANPVLVESIDAKNAFQMTLILSTVSLTPVPIPAGQRLVVEFISIGGTASSTSGATQPVVVLESTLNGGPVGEFVFDLTPTPVPLPAGTFVLNQPTKIYADTLNMGLGDSGATITGSYIGVTISGHLVAIP